MICATRLQRAASFGFIFAIACSSACGGRAFQDELAELDALLNSSSTDAMRVDLEAVEDENVRGLRAQAIEMLDDAGVNFEYAADAWGDRKDELAEEFSRVGLIYYSAAENYSRSADARLQLAEANLRTQEQRERRNLYDDIIRSESELITLLETITQLFERNEEMRRQMATMEAQFQSESRAVYAIQEARVLQREAEGLKCPEFDPAGYTTANASSARAQQHLDEGDFESAYDVALRAMEEYRLTIEAARPDFMAEQALLLSNTQNQALFEEAQRRFGNELAFIDARGVVIVVPALFSRGESGMRQDRVYLLDEVLLLVRQFDNRNILIEGHTQDRGSPETNMALSATRADEVQDWMLQRSVRSSRVSRAGFGEDAPRFDNRTDAGRADNDRIEIIFLVD